MDLYGHLKEGDGSEREDVEEARRGLGSLLRRMDALWKEEGRDLLRRDFPGAQSLISFPYEEVSDPERFHGLMRTSILSCLVALAPEGRGLLAVPAEAIGSLVSEGYHVVNGGSVEPGDTDAIYDTAIRLYSPNESTGYEDLLHSVSTARLACTTP